MIRTRTDEQAAFDLATSALGSGEPGVTLTDDGSRAELSLLGIGYAQIERTGRGVDVAFLVQERDRRRSDLDVGFRPDPIRPEWLRIRLGKEPRRWREADVAGLASRTLSALRAIADVGRWKHLASPTGRFLVIPQSATERSLADARGAGARAHLSHGGVSKIDGAWGSGLLLEGGGTLYVQLTSTGLVLIRATMPRGDDEHLLRDLLADLPEDAFAPAGFDLDVREPLVATASAQRDAGSASSSRLECSLAVGTYRVANASYAPNPSISILLTRLARR